MKDAATSTAPTQDEYLLRRGNPANRRADQWSLVHAGPNDIRCVGTFAVELNHPELAKRLAREELRPRGVRVLAWRQLGPGLYRAVTSVDWPTVPAALWRAITVKGPWDLPIVAPYARAPIAPWSVPLSANPTTLPRPKLCENRRWSTAWRGPLIIHTGRRWDRDAQSDPLIHEMWRALCPTLPLFRAAWTWAGHVTAVAQLVDCHPARPGCCLPWGHSGPAINHLVLTDVRALTTPVRARGLRRLWRPSAELVAAVRPLIPARDADHG